MIMGSRVRIRLVHLLRSSLREESLISLLKNSESDEESVP